MIPWLKLDLFGACMLVAALWPLRAQPADFARNFGAPGYSASAATYATTADQAGNIYFGGHFNTATLAVGDATIVRTGLEDAFVAKLDAFGNASWARSFGGPGAQANVYAVATDHDGNVHVAGSFGRNDLSTPALLRLGPRTVFVLKLDSSGNTIWARAFGGSSAAMDTRGITVDGSGSVYVSCILEDGNPTTPPLTILGKMDAVLLKLDHSGNTVWARNFGGIGAYTYADGIELSGQGGHVVMVGHFWGASLTSPTLPRFGVSDAFAMKLDTSGNVAWARGFGGPGAQAGGGGVASDSSGNVWLCGSFEGGDLAALALQRIGTEDVFVAKLDASGGTMWARNFGGSGARSWCSDVALRAGGGVLAAGGFKWGNLTTPAMPRIGIQDAFVMGLDDRGQLLWIREYGGSGTETWAVGLAVDGSGSFILGGYFAFGSLSVPALARIGFRDAFIIKQTVAAANVPGALSGLWWNASESGWGIHFAQRRNVIFATWYTYDANGNPKWYVASNCTMSAPGLTSGTCNGTLHEVNGPTFFGTAFNPNAVNVVAAGSLSVNFRDANNASMTYTVSGQSRMVPITRQSMSTDPMPSVDYTDLWWNPNESGWGMAITQQGSVMFLAWYVYDNLGKPMWYVASNCNVIGNGCTGTLYRTMGPAFGSVFDSTQIRVFQAGTVTLAFADPNTGTLSYTVNGVPGTKSIARQEF